jgi:predicted nucleic acid-binding Zn ribbon protein
MKNISQALDDFFVQNNFRREMDIVRVWINWKTIVGPELAAMAKPLGRRQKSLIVGVENSLIMQEMRFYSTTLLEHINEFLQWNPFDKVKFELLYNKTSLDQIQIDRPRLQQRLPHTQLSDSCIGNVSFPEEILPSFQSCYRRYVEMMKELKQDK